MLQFVKFLFVPFFYITRVFCSPSYINLQGLYLLIRRIPIDLVINQVCVPMEIITRYNDVSPQLLRKTSTELLINNLNVLGVFNYYIGIIGADDHTRSLPDDIVIEILSRLPVKSLMQFKSVCKHWLFLIKQDTRLIDLHSSRSKSCPNLLYINPMPQKGRFTFGKNKTLRQSISCAEIIEGNSTGDEEEQVEAVISKVRITDDKWLCYDHVLEPVNGLVCFVDRMTHAVMVYNASTREATPWVKSTLLAEENQKIANEGSTLEIKNIRNSIYRIGFDPEKKEHKVFCFWRLASIRPGPCYSSIDRTKYEKWEAFTVGRDTKWRRINAVPNEINQIIIKQALPPVISCRKQVYADGTIYWSNKGYSWDPDSYSPDDPAVIVAFDVGSEKYRVIPIPNFILDEPRDGKYRLPIDMLVLGTHVALLYRMEPCVVKLWMLDEGANRKLENCRGNGHNWSSETITLPFCCDNGVGGSAIAGSTDKIMFELRRWEKSASFTRLYSYDRRNKTGKKIEMDGASSFTLHSQRSLVSTFTETLFPVSANQQGKS
ncbi:F-box/LRR-repeat protein At2g40920-like [Papaver somniferum]|uniref:F-box/LRR-repeat protein At2g40920-like n=1 Tax=Papaver somniferum TaxID=3469 RepID=UPI000E6F5228|nr:F-box/LRR-repeat protein At2g40920-like [Papaver somniferum]